MMGLSRTVFCLFSSVLMLPPVSAQDKVAEPPHAQVTIYSTGSFWKATKPGYKHGMFTGLIFDDKHQLANITPGHFITFNLTPGPHVFSANSWVLQSSEGGAHLKVDLVANQHYYIGAYLSTTPLLVISRPRIELATCQDAQKDTVKATPLDTGHLEKDGIPLAVNETSFPQCQ